MSDAISFDEAVFTEVPTSEEPEHSRGIVRVRTVKWGDTRRGIFQAKQITWLKRLSSGYQCMREDVANIGADEVLDRITNLNECRDGIYEAVICNQSTDWETGYVDDYDYKLIPVIFYGPPDLRPTSITTP